MRHVTKKGVTYLVSTGEVLECLFCKIQNREEPGTITYEDESFVVFKTIKPASHMHLLVTPRQHIRNVNSLSGAAGVALVEKLVEIGKVALGQYAEGAQFSFHVPPLNSIDHLHLHAIASPETMSMWSARKYHQDTFYCQSPEMVIRKLQKSHREASPHAGHGHRKRSADAASPKRTSHGETAGNDAEGYGETGASSKL